MANQQLSILLIDDDEVDRLMVKRAVKKANTAASFVEAVSGSEAISLIKDRVNKQRDFFQKESQNIDAQASTGFFDVILLDYRLPDIDGLQLIAKLKSLNLRSPIIILTGQGDEEIAVEVMKAGAVDYLSKAKIESKSFVKAIKSAIRIERAEQAAILANQRLRASNELLVAKNQELERQQEQIRTQNIELQEAYALKSEFLATMSHELRTPMNAIMGFSQLLLRPFPEPLSDQQQNLVKRIFHNSNNLLEMINEMLDFSKIEAGKLEIKPQKFDLNSLIKATAGEIQSLALAKKLDLITDIQLENNYLVQDSGFIRRIIINLFEPQHRTHPCLQFIKLKGFTHKFIGSCIKSFH